MIIKLKKEEVMNPVVLFVTLYYQITNYFVPPKRRTLSELEESWIEIQRLIKISKELQGLKDRHNSILQSYQEGFDKLNDDSSNTKCKVLIPFLLC